MQDMKYVFLQTIFGFHHYISQVLPNPNNMPTASSKISQQKVLDYVWQDVTNLPDGTTCDIENCRTPNTVLTPRTAWGTTVGDNQTPQTTAYAGSTCIEKAIYTDLIAGATADPDTTVVTVASMARNIRALDLSHRFTMRRAGSAGAPTATPTRPLPEQNSTDKPSKD
jgi:hypothetical protein